MQVINLLKIPVISWLGLTVALMAYSAEVMTNYYLYRDTADWISRAALAGHAGDAASYIGRALQGMENWGVNQGHAALFWKSPATDMALLHKAIQRMHARLEAIAEKYDAPGATESRSSKAYSQVLKDVSLLSGKLPLKAPAHYVWAIRTGLPFEVFFYVGILVFGYGLIRPLIREVTWVDAAFITPFFVGIIKALWFA